MSVIAIAKETAPGETRVAGTAETVRKFVRAGLTVQVQSGAGEQAGVSDDAYRHAGAQIVPEPAGLYGSSDLVLKVNPPQDEDIPLLKPGTVLAAFLRPDRNEELLRRLAEADITAFAMEHVPRITRAQSLDARSSMASLTGYKAVLMAADALPRMLPMMMTAAGTVRPASALVIGAGVAGLQAIAAAHRLGAVVKGVDVRPAVKEQIESLGARFVPLTVEHERAEDVSGYARDLGEQFYRQEQELLAPHVKDADFIVTSAMIPGRSAPRLITEAMVQTMKPGSVIVDLAAEDGGNCSLTRGDQTVQAHGVTIIGALNLPRRLPVHASQMYAQNLAALVDLLLQDGQIRIAAEDEVLSAMLVTHQGQVVNKPAQAAPGRV